MLLFTFGWGSLVHFPPLQEDFSWHPLSACENSLERFRYACFTHPEHSLKGQPPSLEIGTCFVQPTLLCFPSIIHDNDWELLLLIIRTTTPNSENDTERITLHSQRERGLASLCPSHGMYSKELSSVYVLFLAHAHVICGRSRSIGRIGCRVRVSCTPWQVWG
jgi:hypothetical protein